MELYLIRHPRPQVAPGVCYGQTDLGLAEPAAEVAERLREAVREGDTVARMGAFIAEHGALGAGLLEQFGGDMEQAESILENCYHGQFASLAEYMEELTTESVTIPEALRYYVDWDAMARDAEMGGDLFTIETAHGEVHVFSNR